jgi:methyltransferase (TIGR00027 family)
MDPVSSSTALATAAARAAHLVFDRSPWIFEDTLAGALLGATHNGLIAVHGDDETAGPLAAMRVAVTARSRYTEDHLADAINRGIRQYVVLGAGLDTFAYRSRLATHLTVFEVDHPATQTWKRHHLAEAAIVIPSHVRFVSVDFTVDPLRDRLAEAGFDCSQPAFVSWLGVTQYLAEHAIHSTLDVIADAAPGTELVIECLVPDELRDESGHALADFFMPRAAAVGEPWVTFATPLEIAGALSERGMTVVDDVGRRDQVNHAWWVRSDPLAPHELGRLARAVVGVGGCQVPSGKGQL